MKYLGLEISVSQFSAQLIESVNSPTHFPTDAPIGWRGPFPFGDSTASDAIVMDDDQARRTVAGLRAGDPDAWRQLHDTFAERVWIGLARLVGPYPADVADVVQETMLAAARSARSYDETKGSLWNWLWGIARTQLARHFRTRQRQERWKQRPSSWVDEIEPTQIVELETAELAEQVRTALGELPVEYEQLLTSKYLDGESVERIAAREQLTETALRSKLARARVAFRTAYLRMTATQKSETEAAREHS